MELQGFVGPAYRSQSMSADIEALINWYMEPIESGLGNNKAALYPCPGFSRVLLLPTGPIRGVFTQDGRMWAVGGAVLYEVTVNASGVWAFVARGTMLVDGNPVSWASNGDAGHQLVCCSGGTVYVVDLLTNVFTAATTGVNQIAYADGFVLGLEFATSTLKLSNLLDALTWSGSQVAQRNFASDRWRGLIASHDQAWLFGTKTTEVWGDTGANPFPFEPFNNTLIEQGIIAPFSVCQFDNSVAWLGGSEHGVGIVWRATGYQPARMSNSAIEYAIQSYGTITDAVAFSYQEQGHTFYVLTFPTAQATWVYDAALPPTIGWHQRGFWDVPAMQFDAYRPLYHCYFNNMHIVGDRVGAGLHQMSTTLYSDIDGAALRRVRRSPYVATEDQWNFIEQFQLYCDVGIGLSAGQGSDPQVMLRWSDDDGHTWSNEYWTSVGAMGMYDTRAIWRRLGRTRGRTFEVSVTDPVPWRLVNCFLRVTAGTGQS